MITPLLPYVVLCSELYDTKQDPVKPVWWYWDTTEGTVSVLFLRYYEVPSEQ